MHDNLYTALYMIDPNDRETWVHVGMALKSHLGEGGFAMWDEWSRQSPSYKPSSALSVWHSISAEGGITIGRLYHIAMENGWNGVPEKQRPTPERQAEILEELRLLEEERIRKHAYAAKRAQEMLDRAQDNTHPYLERKGFPAVRMKVLDGLLLVPMRDVRTGELLSLQTIDDDGGKKFLTGGRASHAVYRIGNSMCKWYVEGLATGLSVQSALKALYRAGDEVCLTFSSGNLPKVVVQDGRESYVVADHDENTIGEQAARKSHLPYWMPDEVGMDANDFHMKYGLNALRDELRKLTLVNIHDMVNVALT